MRIFDTQFSTMIEIKKIVVTKNKAEVLKKIEAKYSNKEALKSHVRNGLPLKTFKSLNG